MASRPIFLPDPRGPGVVTHSVEFEWFPGFSVAQKQRSIRSLHAAAVEAGLPEPLEVSTKSASPIGVALSAFNLHLRTNGRSLALEVAFQSSKRFEHAGPFPELMDMKPHEIKRDSADREAGRLLGFSFEGVDWPLAPKTAFYDWLYLRALHDNPELADTLSRYSAFTDIEFNPQRSLNCQARSCALYVSISEFGVSFRDIADPGDFLTFLSDNEEPGGVQHPLFE